ncbi:MAG: hypothetical protein IIC89_04390 [Chloroflexi bacterium]|nr:hypothetical protein [Chloroflexota bacterium]
MAELRKYGVSTSMLFPLIERDVVDFEAGATFAAGDVQMIKDEGAAANTTNLPIHEGNGIYSLTLTASEMQAARIVVTVIDQTASKVWEDQAILINADPVPADVQEVHGNETAALGLEVLGSYHLLSVQKSQAGSSGTSIKLSASEPSTDDYWNHHFIRFSIGAVAGEIRRIDDYDGTTKVATIDRAFSNGDPGTDLYVIFAYQGALS